MPIRQSVIVIIGAGIMGKSLARLFSNNGYKIKLIPSSQVLKEIPKGTTLIIEAVTENPGIKKNVLAPISKLLPDSVPIVSNTSTLNISDLSGVVTNPERFAGMHFFNPATKMRLVEITKGLYTTPETVGILWTIALHLDKHPIMSPDNPGFIANNLGLALFIEASKLLEEGSASVKDIDDAMKLGWGHKMGPFETADLVGLDTRWTSLYYLHKATNNPKWWPPKILFKLLELGYKGVKPNSRGGYYKYYEGRI